MVMLKDVVQSLDSWQAQEGTAPEGDGNSECQAQVDGNLGVCSPSVKLMSLYHPGCLKRKSDHECHR